MPEEDINENMTTQRRIIISAIVLAILVAVALWYVFVVSPQNSEVATITTPTVSETPPLLISVPATEPSPQFEGFNPANPVIPSFEPERPPRISPQAAQTWAPVAPTSKTGMSDFAMLIMPAVTAAGAMSLRKIIKRR